MNQPECPICMNPITRPFYAHTHNINHRKAGEKHPFHKRCLMRYIKNMTHANCPVCRVKLTPHNMKNIRLPNKNSNNNNRSNQVNFPNSNNNSNSNSNSNSNYPNVVPQRVQYNSNSNNTSNNGWNQHVRDYNVNLLRWNQHLHYSRHLSNEQYPLNERLNHAYEYATSNPRLYQLDNLDNLTAENTNYIRGQYGTLQYRN